MDKNTDYELITKCWHMLRDYADITVDQTDRWSALVDEAAEWGDNHKDKFSRRMIAMVLEELNDRAREARVAA